MDRKRTLDGSRADNGATHRLDELSLEEEDAVEDAALLVQGVST